MDPNGLRDMEVLTRGQYGGLGIEVTMEGALLKVVRRSMIRRPLMPA
jgi:carboxyl-terminal processing protease